RIHGRPDHRPADRRGGCPRARSQGHVLRDARRRRRQPRPHAGRARRHLHCRGHRPEAEGVYLPVEIPREVRGQRQARHLSRRHSHRHRGSPLASADWSLVAPCVKRRVCALRVGAPAAGERSQAEVAAMDSMHSTSATQHSRSRDPAPAASTSEMLVATDLTDRSERALGRALQLYDELEAKHLSLLHVVAEGLPPDLAKQQLAGAEAFLRTRMAKEPARRGSEGVSEIIVCTGDPFSTILTQSIDRSADLIIIGAPGKHRYADIFMGTTAERVIRFSDKPVLMVKQAPGEPYRRILVAFDGSEGAIRGLQMALA